MPVTARLLQRLHETLGADATNDLFAWWEDAITVNRATVREIADLYFERFDATLERRLSELREQSGTRLEKGLSELWVDMANQRADLIRWMVIFWAGTVIPLAGLAVALAKT